MRKTWILSGVIVALLAGSAPADAACYCRWRTPGRHAAVFHTHRPRVIRFQARAAMGADDAEPLYIASAVLGGPPLIWSPTAAALVPPPYGSYRLPGRTIPIEAVIGRRVLPILITPPSVGYNNPTSAYGVVDPEIVLMRIPRPPSGSSAGLVY